ncbi:MAG TPA: hypothetical protein VGX51_14715 [Solirubrobacteraceae bacterium]|nr:hypothetical protein [Solirubrobacteraceae bacterium]
MFLSPESSSRLKPLAATVPAALAACVLLAACGGSGSPSASNAAAKEQSDERTAESRFEQFARCLREHGINAEALSRPGGGHGIKVKVERGGPGAMEAAEKACARYRPERASKGNEPPAVKAEHEEQTRRFAKCMREHGIPMQAGPSGGVFFKGTPGGASSPESPAFQAAQRTCQKLLPGGGPGQPAVR